ncbi:SDR family oxidoreductase [Patescibacteria group bacterium]|nr:SDR family oxidoreductase [Patescibacteria group bacterium]
MNKEKRKFKKVIKAKKRRERKKKILENNKTIHKIVRSIKKTWFLDEKKKRSKIIKDLNQKKIKELRKILNITSYYGNIGDGNIELFAYSVAKAALSSMTVNLAKVDGKVLVNAIAPGYTWTPPWKGISESEKKIYESRTMINRYVTPEEIAHATIAVLENDAMTGQIITVDGGLSLQKLEEK